MFSTADTIVAISTPIGRGGLGVVRLSGPDSHRIALELMGRRRALRPRRATFGRIVDCAPGIARPVDQVVVTWFAAPRSFTGDDVVEISAHGSQVLLRRILELAIEAGARLGEPGEFTLRAHLNGRLDLIQAEAIADLVDAVTPLQARAAMDQLEGTLTAAIARIDAQLFDLAARLEASLDFPEEGFHFITRDDASSELGRARGQIEALVQEGRAGRVVREGSLVAIAGRPNAGKSSLFNALVGASRAIVTDVPGTTRDLLTERVDLNGLPVTLVDTAGLREARDAIEAEGVRRAREAQQIAALTLLLLDGSVPLADEDRRACAAFDKATIVITKIDLPRVWSAQDLPPEATKPVEVSIVNGAGLEQLKDNVVAALTSRDDWRDPPAVSNLRHVSHLVETLATLERVDDLLKSGATEELVLAELSDARRSLEEITGRRAPEALLRHIFGQFCIGK